MSGPESQVPTLADVLARVEPDDACRIVLGLMRSKEAHSLEELLSGVPPGRAAAIRASLSFDRRAVTRAGREVPTLGELVGAASGLPPDKGRQILVRARPRPGRPPTATGVPPPPVYASWEDFLARTTPAERRRWCTTKASKANGPRLMSGRPEAMISTEDVLAVLEQARGRCAHCGSLAVERRPPGPWGRVGRRIGSLGHRIARFNGGPNTLDNLNWCCMWCNTWPEERIKGTTDHGGYFPESNNMRDVPV